MPQKHSYNKDKEYPNDPEECSHENKQDVIDSIGEVAGDHIKFEECEDCGAKIEE